MKFDFCSVFYVADAPGSKAETCKAVNGCKVARLDGSTSRALLFGHEETLLLSRKGLLKTVDCECLVVTTLFACREALLQGGFQLIILCQTVSGDECTEASDFAAEHCGGTPLLVMYGRHAKCKTELEYVLLDAKAGPDTFIKTVQGMLAHAEQTAGYPLAGSAEPARLAN